MFNVIGWFVQNPLRVLALDGLYVAGWDALRLALPARRTNALLVPAAYCVAFAAWEWLVTVQTPDANIRVDLLLIWPALLLLTWWSIWRAVRPRA